MIKEPTVDQKLTLALRMIVDEFLNLGYDEKIIFGKVNLIIQGFIDDQGGFTEEYLALAREAMALRESKIFKESLNIPSEISLIPEVSLILPKA